MCASWAQAIVDFAEAKGYKAPPKDMTEVHDNTVKLQISKTILGCLPRGRKVPPLLTDWLDPQLVQIDRCSSFACRKTDT